MFLLSKFDERQNYILLNDLVRGFFLLPAWNFMSSNTFFFLLPLSFFLFPPHQILFPLDYWNLLIQSLLLLQFAFCFNYQKREKKRSFVRQLYFIAKLSFSLIIKFMKSSFAWHFEIVPIIYNFICSIKMSEFMASLNVVFILHLQTNLVERCHC